MVGQTVGPFEISALLGKGGMGEVYQALDTRLDRQVALKILPDVFADDAERLARFEREAKVLASLQHQNIASIYGLENLEGRPALVMELAPGEDLSRRLEAGSIPAAEVEKIARQLARGLEYAHEQGIIHRDLKPANVKVHRDGQVKILDFGLARALAATPGGGPSADQGSMPTLTQGLTSPGMVLGTAAYMSPEQARGYDVDRRSDIWAFGVILFEMLTGQRLFEGETSTDTLAAIIHKEPDWDSIPTGTDPLLVQLCRRCLVKDPSKRLRDIGDVRIALEDGADTMLGLSAVGLGGGSPRGRERTGGCPGLGGGGFSGGGSGRGGLSGLAWSPGPAAPAAAGGARFHQHATRCAAESESRGPRARCGSAPIRGGWPSRWWTPTARSCCMCGTLTSGTRAPSRAPWGPIIPSGLPTAARWASSPGAPSWPRWTWWVARW